MDSAFSSIHNHNEGAVLDAVAESSARYPALRDDELKADVACVALNRLPTRYIRHSVDYLFYRTEAERSEHAKAVADAVAYAFEFVQAREAMRARG